MTRAEAKETMTMHVISRKRVRAWLALVLATAGLALLTSPASAATVTIDLVAKEGTATLTGSVSVPIWGFAFADVSRTGDTTDTSAAIANVDTTGLVAGMGVAGDGIPAGATIVSVDGATDLTISDAATATATDVSLTFSTAAGLPGPVLTLDEGDEVTINVTNALPAGHTISFEVPGISFDAGPTDAAVGETVTRTFTASGPGTFLYQSGGDAGRQEAMGLYGALIVRPTTAGQVYDDASTSFDVESVLVLSQVDPNFNADPDSFDMLHYLATYWLINGKAYPDTAPIPASAGDRVLLRYLNAGYDNTSMALLGLHEHVVARDGLLLTDTFDAAAETFPAGATEDAIVTIPSTAPPSASGFPLFNRNLHVTNGSGGSYATPGGMLTFIAT
jgi:FtsP/CotA-like multicopper oxidase with cupredoxin domain